MGKASRNLLVYLTIFAVILAMQTSEVEGRRKILSGRRVITRTYYREMAVPAWAVVVLVGIGEIILGGVIYLVMKKIILDTPLSSSYAVAPTNDV